MKFFLPTLLIILFVLLACSSKEEPKVEVVDGKLEQAQLEVDRAKAELSQSVVEPMDKDRAIQLAARHLALKQVRWGSPVAVEEDEDRFYVTYQTPKQELRLIGARVILVDKVSKVVSAQRRR